MDSFDAEAAMASGFQADPAPAWITEPDIEPMSLKRQLLAAVKVDDHRLLVTGGKSGGSQLSSTALYDSQKNKWEEYPELNVKRSGHAAVKCGSKIYVMGGRAGYGSRLDSIECLDLSKKPLTWKTLDVSLSSQKSGCAAAVVGSVIAIIGGDDGKNKVDSVDIFFTSTGVMKAGPPLTLARNGCAAGVVGHTIYVVGGEDDKDNRLNTIESLSLGKDAGHELGKWETCTATLNETRYYPAVAVVEHALVILGGSNSDYKYLQTAEVFDTLLNTTWTLPDMFKTRWGSSAVTLGESHTSYPSDVYVIGGLGGGTHASMEMIKLELTKAPKKKNDSTGVVADAAEDTVGEMKSRLGLLESLVSDMSHKLAKAEAQQTEFQALIKELNEKVAGLTN